MNATPANLHCTQCGYDLRGALTSTQCPECGQPIELSRRWASWRTAPRRWLVHTTFASILLTLGYALSGAVVGIEMLAPPREYRFDLMAAIRISSLLMLLGGVILLHSPRKPRRWVERAAQASLLAAVLLLIVQPRLPLNDPILAFDLTITLALFLLTLGWALVLVLQRAISNFLNAPLSSVLASAALLTWIPAMLAATLFYAGRSALQARLFDRESFIFIGLVTMGAVALLASSVAFALACVQRLRATRRSTITVPPHARS